MQNLLKYLALISNGERLRIIEELPYPHISPSSSVTTANNMIHSKPTTDQGLLLESLPKDCFTTSMPNQTLTRSVPLSFLSTDLHYSPTVSPYSISCSFPNCNQGMRILIDSKFDTQPQTGGPDLIQPRECHHSCSHVDRNPTCQVVGQQICNNRHITLIQSDRF